MTLTMYEMYPDRWTAEHDERTRTTERPRRRARRTHRVDPQIIVALEQLRSAGK
ncbi:hypothetical protein FHX74_003112 [Friedmanniella endophytica]|uniref:Transposase n=1 Tax=Microlunatus kandeliicorticis TaxID=1759536 RepID=A0A7W3IUG0_9ACTN|nr:hypothetical protein [Microlunatus kandeliicorticis]MBA8795476.1 hypothetical protein [Microlunatus kandeliicorticis]